jgi:hypothetical protein
MMSGVYISQDREAFYDQTLGYVVYARHTVRVEQYFIELARKLERYSNRVIATRLDDTRYQGEEQILVEFTAVRLS